MRGANRQRHPLVHTCAADDRKRAGQLEFHDLLVLARALLRDPNHGPAVRATLHERYQRLLLDEFQDTDPIQIELAVRIAAADPTSESSGSRPWDEVPVTPGQLFVVGDPKQSIYRFRRADISTFLATRDRFGTEGAGTVELTANFRTVRPVIEWVNTTFAALMEIPDDIDMPVPSQADYLPLQPTRTAPRTGPPVSVLGRQEHPKGTKADDLRAAEADEVAATVARAIDEGWDVDDGSGWLATGLPGRHHGAGARPNVAAVSRGCVRRSRHPVPGRVELARLLQPGGAGPAHGAARPRRSHQLSPHRLGTADAAARMWRR